MLKRSFSKTYFTLQTSESTENALKVENDKLREVADVARNQIELFENRKLVESIELEALRHEVIDLQTQTDEKALVGKLHRQIIGLQLKENEYQVILLNPVKYVSD